MTCGVHGMQFQGQTVLVGVDDMDLFKGIELKLMAVERVLDHHPEWRGKLVLIQVTMAPRSVNLAATQSWRYSHWDAMLAQLMLCFAIPIGCQPSACIKLLLGSPPVARHQAAINHRSQ